MSPIEAITADITTLEVDAIVNAANTSLAGGGGVDGAIHLAGGPTIAAQCRDWVADNGNLPTGEAMVTDGGLLPASLVIHTVGPIWAEHTPEGAELLLAACYRNSLAIAAEKNCQSIAFPNISTGVYGFPKPRAAKVAISTVKSAMSRDDVVKSVVFACFDSVNREIYEELLGD